MYRKSRLPDSLSWQAIGWIEIPLLEADAARRFNVSRFVVHRLCSQITSKDSVSKTPVLVILRIIARMGDHLLDLY